MVKRQAKRASKSLRRKRGSVQASYKVKKTSRRGSKTVRAKEKLGAGWWFLLWAIVILSACIGIAFWASTELTTEKIVDRKFIALSKKYYEEVIYPDMMDGKSLELNEREERLAKYKEQGIGPVRLRQLVNYFEREEPGVREAFSKPGYECNTNSSWVTFKPVAPYGKYDYEIVWGLECGESED